MIHRMQRMHIGHIAFLAVLILSAVMLCSAHTYADTSGNVTLSVGQSFNVMGEEEEGFSDSRDYQLVANDSSVPMPGGNYGGTYTFTLSGDEEHVFTTSGDGGKVSEPALYFSNPGVYEYTVKPLTSEPNEKYDYEDTTYNVRIYVKNNPLVAGDLIVEKIVCENNQGEKPDYIRYHCSYKGEAVEPEDPDDDPDEDTDDEPGEDSPKKGTKVKTGDTSALMVWGVTFALVTAMLMILLFRRRRDNNNNRF